MTPGHTRVVQADTARIGKAVVGVVTGGTGTLARRTDNRIKEEPAPEFDQRDIASLRRNVPSGVGLVLGLRVYWREEPHREQSRQHHGTARRSESKNDSTPSTRRA